MDEAFNVEDVRGIIITGSINRDPLFVLSPTPETVFGHQPPMVSYARDHGRTTPCSTCKGELHYSPPPTSQSEGVYFCKSCDIEVDRELAIPRRWQPGKFGGSDAIALPILWDGKVVCSGWDHLRRCMPADWLGWNGYKGHPPLPQAFNHLQSQRLDGGGVFVPRNKAPTKLPRVTTCWRDRLDNPSWEGLWDVAGLAVACGISYSSLYSLDMEIWTPIPLLPIEEALVGRPQRFGHV